MEILSTYDATEHNIGQFSVTYAEYDHTCPEIPINGKPNCYAAACLTRTGKDGSCSEKGCKLGNALRRKHGLAPIIPPPKRPVDEVRRERRQENNRIREIIRLNWKETNRCKCGQPSMAKRWLKGRKPICSKCSKMERDRVMR